jgi:hypothetical protein
LRPYEIAAHRYQNAKCENCQEQYISPHDGLRSQKCRPYCERPIEHHRAAAIAFNEKALYICANAIIKSLATFAATAI